MTPPGARELGEFVDESYGRVNSRDCEAWTAFNLCVGTLVFVDRVLLQSSCDSPLVLPGGGRGEAFAPWSYFPLFCRDLAHNRSKGKPNSRVANASGMFEVRTESVSCSVEGI
jgi:hypothetical protein